MRRQLPVLLLIVALVGWASGGLGRVPAGAQGPRTVTVALYADAVTLDPEDTNDNLSFSIERMAYDGLLGFTPDMKIKPELATSWEASKDARVFTFHLRRGVRFQDGTPFNAEAVKINFDRARDPTHKLRRYSLYEMISSVDVVDEYTVRFTLRKPFGAMLYNFAHPASRIISPAAIKRGESFIARNMVGTGPFKFVSWTPGQEIVLERNPEYWESGRPMVDRVVFKLVPEDASRVAMLLSGEAQFVFPVPGVQVDAVSRAANVAIQKRWSIYAYYVALNTQHVPFNNVAVRRALNYAVDKNALVRVILRGFGRPLDAPITPGVSGYSPVQPGGWPYDPAKAKALLTEAGFPRGFTSTMWLGNQTVSGWSPSTGDADWGLRPLFGSESWPPTLLNLAFYKNPKVDALLQDALSTADQGRRNRDYAQAMRIIWDDAPWIFLYNPQILAGERTTVTGVYALPDGTVDAREAALTGR